MSWEELFLVYNNLNQSSGMPEERIEEAPNHVGNNLDQGGLLQRGLIIREFGEDLIPLHGKEESTTTN